MPTYTCKKGKNIAPGIGATDSANDAYSSAYMYLGCAKVGKKYGPGLGSVAVEIDDVFYYDTLTMSFGDAIQFTQTCGPSGTTSDCRGPQHLGVLQPVLLHPELV